MNKMKLFSVILFLSVLSNSAFAEIGEDPIEHEITMGKIAAAELATEADKVTTQSNALIQRALRVQEELGFNPNNGQIDMDRIEGIGQLVDIIDRSLKEINSLEDTRKILEMNQELEELLK